MSLLCVLHVVTCLSRKSHTYKSAVKCEAWTPPMASNGRYVCSMGIRAYSLDLSYLLSCQTHQSEIFDMCCLCACRFCCETSNCRQAAGLLDLLQSPCRRCQNWPVCPRPACLGKPCTIVCLPACNRLAPLPITALHHCPQPPCTTACLSVCDCLADLAAPSLQ